MQRVAGFTLVEITVSAGVIVLGLLALYLGLVQGIRSAQRAELMTVATNVMNSQLSTDAELPTVSITSFTNQPVASLPQGLLSRDVSTPLASPTLLRITYTLRWIGQGGAQTLRAEYEHTNNGLSNPGIQ